MKWESPAVGTTREEDWFFLLPTTIDGVTHWLETRRCVVERYGGDMYAGTGPGWWPIKVLDTEPK